MIRAVVFDLDGVLIDSEPVYMDHEYLKILEYIPDLKKEALMPTVGMSMKMYNAYMASLLGFEVDSDEYREYRNHAGPQLVINYKEIMRNNAKQTLQKIKEMGYHIALASSGDYKDIMMILDQCEIKDYFEVICSGDMFVQSKPNPEIYLTTFGKLGVKPEECLVVEDSEMGLAAGVASGAHVCCMRETRFNFKQENAEYYIDDLSEIIKILARQVKAIFFDIDGTLTDSETHKMIDSTKQALDALKNKGIKRFISTGRALVELWDANIIDEKMFDGAIYMNGQYCVADGKVVSSHPLTKDQLLVLKDFLIENDASCTFYANEVTYTNKVDDMLVEVQRYIGSPIPEVRSIDNLENEELYQVCPILVAEKEKELLSRLDGVKSTRWHPYVSDMMSTSGGKDAGIRDIAKALGIDLRETMSFGDGHNDVAMFEVTPISIAMGNADDEVKEKASYVTSRFDQDGVINALKYFEILE